MTIDEAIKDFQCDIESIRFHEKDPHYSGKNWRDSFTMTIERDQLAMEALRNWKRTMDDEDSKLIIDKLKSQLYEWMQKTEDSDHDESYKDGACLAYEDVLEYLEFYYPS